MPDVELKAKITADDAQFGKAMEGAAGKISAVRKEANAAQNGLGAMNKSLSGNAEGAADLSGGMNRLKQALGQVSPELGRFAGLLDPKAFTGAAAGLGAMGAAAGALLVVMDRLGKTINDSLMAPIQQMDQMVAAAEKMHGIVNAMAQSDAKLLADIRSLAQKKEKSADDLAQLQTLVAAARSRGMNLNMSTIGEISGVKEAQDAAARNAYNRQLALFNEQILAQQNKIESLQGAARLQGGVRTFANWASPLGWLNQGIQAGASALGLDGKQLDLTKYVMIAKDLPDTEKKLQEETAKLDDLERQRRILVERENVPAMQDYRRRALPGWQRRVADAQAQAEAEAAAAAYDPELEAATGRLQYMRNLGGALDAAGWQDMGGMARAVESIEGYLATIAAEKPVRVAKEE